MKDSSEYIKFKGSLEKFNKTYLSKSGGSMSGNIDMNSNDILKVRKLTFYDGGNITIPGKITTDNINVKNNLIFNFKNTNYVITFRDFSSNTLHVALPSINNQPINLMRTTILYNPNVSQILLGGMTSFLILDINNNIVENQLNLDISGNIISPSQDISGQYVEIYANIEIKPSSNHTEISFDISGVDCNILETLDTRHTNRINDCGLTYGPYLFIPSEWTTCRNFVFKLKNHTNNLVHIHKFKIVLKSYLI